MTQAVVVDAVARGRAVARPLAATVLPEVARRALRWSLPVLVPFAVLLLVGASVAAAVGTTAAGAVACVLLGRARRSYRAAGSEIDALFATLPPPADRATEPSTR